MSGEGGEDQNREGAREARGFDTGLIREPLSSVPVQEPLVLGSDETVTRAVRAMQREHTGCVLVTNDGKRDSKLVGIFTERDILLRIVDRGKNPATLPMSEVMTPDPEVLNVKSTVAHALNKMSVGGFRHIPVVDEQACPAFVVSVRDIVEFLVRALPREALDVPIEGLPAEPTRGGT